MDSPLEAAGFTADDELTVYSDRSHCSWDVESVGLDFIPLQCSTPKRTRQRKKKTKRGFNTLATWADYDYRGPLAPPPPPPPPSPLTLRHYIEPYHPKRSITEGLSYMDILYLGSLPDDDLYTIFQPSLAQPEQVLQSYQLPAPTHVPVQFEPPVPHPKWGFFPPRISEIRATIERNLAENAQLPGRVVNEFNYVTREQRRFQRRVDKVNAQFNSGIPPRQPPSIVSSMNTRTLDSYPTDSEYCYSESEC